jgi:hypothetical protein
MGHFSLAVCLSLKAHFEAFLLHIVVNFVHVMLDNTDPTASHLLAIRQGDLFGVKARSFIEHLNPAVSIVFVQFQNPFSCRITLVAMANGVYQCLFETEAYTGLAFFAKDPTLIHGVYSVIQHTGHSLECAWKILSEKHLAHAGVSLHAWSCQTQA